jgi:2-iminobutanoate/2-iminopropanoate deaminase
MARNALQPDGMPKPRFPYSPVVVSGDLVYTAGQVAQDAEGSLVSGGIEVQTRQVLENIRACVEAAGCTLDDVIKVNAFLANLADFEGYNTVYREFFGEPYPARTSVQAGLPPGILVEIEAVARRSS